MTLYKYTLKLKADDSGKTMRIKLSATSADHAIDIVCRFVNAPRSAVLSVVQGELLYKEA